MGAVDRVQVIEPRQPAIWIVRHGETDWSRTGRHTGRTDISLTDAGVEQARAVGERLRGRRFALVLSSPLRRAWETCRLAGFGEIAQTTDDLLEWDYGAYEGRTTAAIREEVAGWTIWTGDLPRGETAEEVAVRARRVIAAAVTAKGDVALFAHGHVLRILTACWLELAPREGRRFALETASIGELGYENATRVIRRWNL